MSNRTRTSQTLVNKLQCKGCGAEFPAAPVHVCEYCFGPLEVVYDDNSVARDLTRELIESRPPDIWRYRELLPLEGAPKVGRGVGFTPLIPAPRLGRALGIEDLWIKNDAVNHPTLSFKDRVVAVAVNRALEFSLDAVGCASTGNLANAVAAQAATAGLPAWIFIPEDLEPEKIVATAVYGPRLVRVRGVYDDVNRLCAEIADRFGWGLVNVNLRPYYAEGSKTVAFEIAEQLGWRAPANVIAPMAGGALVTKIGKGLGEFDRHGLVAGASGTRIFGAQAAGCAPIVEAFQRGDKTVKPVRPNTIARSLAIGNPADGQFAIETMKKNGGYAESADDRELVDGIRLLAETEGVFTETAGGVTVAVARKLARDRRLRTDGPTVVCITGNGLKTPSAVSAEVDLGPVIDAHLSAVEELVEAHGEAAAARAAASGTA